MNILSTRSFDTFSKRTKIAPVIYMALAGAAAYGYLEFRRTKQRSGTTEDTDPSGGARDPEKPFGNNTRDQIDQASWESFPASDPPGW